MKKILILFLGAVLAASCGPTKVVADSYKVMKGYWNLDDISYDASGKYKISIFNDASSDCFEGSTWRFIPNNNTGVYTINDSDCSSGDRHFIFTVQEIDKATGLYDFMLKPTNEKKKSETQAGYRLRLTQLSDETMQWTQTVYDGGNPVTIYMNFSKQ